MTTQVLIVEDSLALVSTYMHYLEAESYHLKHVVSGAEAIACLQADPPQVMVLDLGLPDMPGLEILEYIRKHQLPTEVVVVTAETSTDVAVTAMREGARDFITKPLNATRLRVTVKNALEHFRLSEIAEVFQEDFARSRFHGFIGSSLKMQAVYRMIESAAPSKATAFITGDSGTGKELCAEAIHKLSSRADQPFVAINCAAIPRELIESEIFGHVKGAFTGASSDRCGAAKKAHKGTLFLDELCEMDLDLQSKLLRFIQSGTFQRVGSNKVEKVDVRFICATNRDAYQEVSKGNFREDLFYRLHVIPIHIPPLRERKEDLMTIANELLHAYAKEENKLFKRFSPDVQKILHSHQWLGNVRELQNVIRNMVVLHHGEEITMEMLPAPLNQLQVDSAVAKTFQPKAALSNEAEVSDEDLPSMPNMQVIRLQPLWMTEREAIQYAIDECDGNVPKAAAALDVSASTIYRKLQAWQVRDEKQLN